MQTQLSKKLEDQAFTSKQKYKAKLIAKLQSALEEQRSESNGELQKLQQEYEHHIAQTNKELDRVTEITELQNRQLGQAEETIERLARESKKYKQMSKQRQEIRTEALNQIEQQVSQSLFKVMAGNKERSRSPSLRQRKQSKWSATPPMIQRSQTLSSLVQSMPAQSTMRLSGLDKYLAESRLSGSRGHFNGTTTTGIQTPTYGEQADTEGDDPRSQFGVCSSEFNR